ncbi:MAG TPA: hypothetical protein EYO58_10365 [Flavobacteriales bacterium]|nr:hypothetical protein [Flavobacteriales bacterium]
MGNRQSNVYCGNNRAATGGRPIGTRSRCLRVGIGKGMSLPCTSSYNETYQPIDTRRFYCGNQLILPNNYTDMGSPALCLKKGIGIGKVMKARNGCEQKKISYILIFFILSISIFLVLFYTKPKFVTKENSNNEKVLDGEKLAIYTSLFIFILAFTIWLIFIKFR